MICFTRSSEAIESFSCPRRGATAVSLATYRFRQAQGGNW
jgi:hypothetical protein